MKFSPAKLRDIRLRRGFTVTEAARRAGMIDRKGIAAHASWIRLESGDIRSPSLNTLTRIAAAVNASPLDLID